jgi:hypothetical protein
MKITAFNPQIVTKDSEPLIRLFEEMGFEKRHTKEGIGKFDITAVRMKNPDGFHVDISHADVGQANDTVTIRMNVDDFNEAYRLLTEHGFVNEFEGRIAETGSSRNAVMSSPSGLKITLIQHIRKPGT